MASAGPAHFGYPAHALDKEAAVIGYAVTQKPDLASYRLRVALPAPHTGHRYEFSTGGDLTFFYKLGNPAIARGCKRVVFDVVNDHFDYDSVLQMANLADAVTAGSAAMAEKVRLNVGRDAVVIDDPYENEEGAPQCEGDAVLWFGHSVNLPSLTRYDLRKLNLVVCSNAVGAVTWSRANEDRLLSQAAAVILTGTNPGASTNRVVKAIRAGRFVVVPKDCAESWRQFADYIWIGEIRNGVSWALNNREEACRKIKAGQEYIRGRFSPEAIGSRWGSLFDSILGAGQSAKTAGLALTTP
jgi:hypothetical protein